MKVTIQALVSGIVLAGWASAQEIPVTPVSPYAGEVATRTLHVRSGPSTNYYPVLRLSEGTRVEVVGQESGWLAITPPAGCFSLIAAKYVDKSDGGAGVVNADNVRVRAGSDLSPHNYAIQLKLSKGAPVRVLGTLDAEFLKIEPPPGARVWVAGEYVRKLGASSPVVAAPSPDKPAAPAAPAVSSSTDNPPDVAVPLMSTPPAAENLAAAPPATAVESGEEEFASGDEDGPSSPAPTISTEVVTIPPLAPAPATDEKSVASSSPTSSPASPDAAAALARENELETLDAQLNAEMEKPLLQRDPGPLLPRYRELVEQSGDEYTQAYARIRVQQIEAALEMIEAVKSVGRLRNEVHTVRQTAMTERSSIRHLPVRRDGGFDIIGELRPSAVYNSPIGPRRYRLVDPNASPARTLGYVEIPLDASVDLGRFLGRRVGIRAHDRISAVGDVDPLSIYIASEIVALHGDGSTPTADSVRIPAGATVEDATGASLSRLP